MVKLNIDVAILNDHTTLVVVAWDNIVEILKAWAKDHLLCEPVQAEAKAILWTLKLVNVEKYNDIIMEGDAKTCFDFLNSKSFGWKVSNVLNNVLKVGISFHSCTFDWVRREANGVAHAFGKVFLSS